MVSEQIIGVVAVILNSKKMRFRLLIVISILAIWINPYTFSNHKKISFSKNTTLNIPIDKINSSMFWLKYLGNYYDTTGGKSIRIKLPHQDMLEYGLLANSPTTNFLFILSHLSDEEIERSSTEGKQRALRIFNFGVYQQDPNTNFYHAYMDNYNLRSFLVSNEPSTLQFEVLALCGVNRIVESSCGFSLIIEEKNLLIEFSLTMSELSDYDSIKKYLEALIESWKAVENSDIADSIFQLANQS